MVVATQFYPGKRLCFDGQLCTVRYHGTIEGAKGEWLGVEWDNPSRGKHCGEHQGIKYFDCLSPSPTSASFIRPTRASDPQRSFVEALKWKYASEGIEDPNVKIVFVTQPGDNAQHLLSKQDRPIKFSGKIAEEVGFDKIRKQLSQLSELKIIILDGLRICRPEDRLRSTQEATGTDPMTLHNNDDIRKTCSKATELDLSRNLFEEWREVVGICRQLDNLTSLRLDGNRFRDIKLTKAEHDLCVTAFSGVKSLKLEEDLLSWEDLADITHQFPDLTSFSASSNMYTTLTQHFLNPSITDLVLEDNSIKSLSSLGSLTTLPNLQRLILKSNKISKISDGNSPVPVFSLSVREVDLSFNDISSWAMIQELEHVFPGLDNLRVSHNPLYESLQGPDGRRLTADDGYMLTLARLGRLKMLNHSPVTDKERLNAESYYLSLIVKEVQFAAESREKDILESHPRYKWLCEEYGEPEIRRSEDAINPNSLEARLMQIRFYLADEPTNVYTTKLPMRFSAYTVMGDVGGHYGINPMHCRLVWETGDWIPVADSDGSDYEDEDLEEDDEADTGRKRVMREVHIVPGTRTIGTWIDGREATVRVEIRPGPGSGM